MNLYKTYGISLLFFLVVILLLLAYLIFPVKIVEINLYDTYYIVSKKTLAAGTAISMFIFTLVYQLFFRLHHRLNEKLGTVHFLFTILGAMIILSTPVADSTPGGYAEMRHNMNSASLHCLIGLVLFCLGQFVLAFNVGLTFFKKMLQ